MKFKIMATLLSGICLVLGFQQCGTVSQKQVTVYRDTWGVPHIYGASEKDVAFGFGYAQAEDRLEQIFSFYRWAEGSLAEVFGPDFLEEDVTQRIWRHAELARQRYAEIPQPLREILESFIAGIHAFMDEHPDRIPRNALELQPWHPVALGRAFIWGWPLDQAIDDLNRGRLRQPHVRGSNQWAVSGKRTASGAPILHIDPHLNWMRDGHWVEARLHGGDLHVCGICVVGTPFVGLGHNRFLAWAATTGGPDCGDVYEEILDENNPLRYQYQNSWREITVDTIAVNVLKNDTLHVIRRTVLRTHHGPIYRQEGNKAFAIALPYENEIALVEQLFAMNLAKSLSEFKEALEMRQFMPQNILVADQEGNIYYQRTGRVPIRDQNYDWSKPVPGHIAATEWQGIHPTADLVQTLNPEIGFLQNCNISPGTMIPASPMVSDKYPGYVYNDRTERSNTRGRRAVELLNRATALDLEGAMEIAVDTKVDGVEVWLQAIDQAFQKMSAEFDDMADEVALLRQWNGHLDKESEAATLYRHWRRKLRELTNAPGNAEALTEATAVEQRMLLQALRNATQAMITIYGSDKVPWGNTVVVKRGDRSFPLDGGSFENDLSVLRAVWGRETADGVTVASGGQTGPMLVLLTRPVRSVSVLPWGQSDDPNSPHYFDQGMKLFSERKFKPTWFEYQELQDHIQSQKLLSTP